MDSSNPYDLVLISGIALGDDGVYFSQNWIAAGKYLSSIYCMNDSGVRRITFGDHERQPCYEGGKLYYISRENGKDRVMVLSGMSEPVQICEYGNIVSYAPYRNGVLVTVSENFKSTRPFVITRLKYKHDTTGLLRKRRSLYFSGEPARRLVGGSYDVSDVRTNGDRIIISSSNVNDDYSLKDLYEVDFVTGDLKKLTKKHGGIDDFDISPDGRIAFSGHRGGVKDWATRRLFFLGNSKPQDIGNTAGTYLSTDIFDDSGGDLMWDGGRVFLLGQTGGVVSLYSSDGASTSRITGDGMSIRHFSARNGKLAFSYSCTNSPSVLVTEYGYHNPNPEVRAREAETVSAGPVEGWCILNGESAPSILFIHGGPHGSFGNVYYIEMQYFASLGYNILYCNPRGSMGYGEEFAEGSVGKWGEGDAEDIMNFLGKVKSKFSLSGKVGVKGISYGGYMVNWLVTQTDLFSAAISEKGVSNLLSSCGTSDIGYWFDSVEEIGRSDPWSPESIKLFMEKSPITFVKNVKTPTLLIHGEEDHRCPIEQSEQFFTALKFYGVESMFIRLPGESHELENREEPVNRLETIGLKREWFEKFLNKPLKLQAGKA